MADSGHQTQRIGHAEREAAERELALHTNAGRLTEQERVERVDAARAAVTRADLDAVFADLPRPDAPPYLQVSDAPAWPGPTVSGPPPAPMSDSAPPPAPTPQPTGSTTSSRMLAVSGSVATFLFLACGMAFDGWAWAWVFWLAVPLVGILTSDDDDQKRLRRERKRGTIER